MTGPTQHQPAPSQRMPNGTYPTRQRPPWVCLYAGRDGCAGARLYACGPRCDNHRPGVVRGAA